MRGTPNREPQGGTGADSGGDGQRPNYEHDWKKVAWTDRQEDSPHRRRRTGREPYRPQQSA